MPLRDTSGIGERVPRELIEADFSIAGSFVEMADEESGRDNGKAAAQLLQKAEEILGHIRERLLRMMPEQKEVFEARCEELAESIRRVRGGE